MQGTSGISWEDERRHFGFYPAALVDDLTNVVLDYLCTGLDHMDIALTEIEEDDVMHAGMVHHAIDDVTEWFRAGMQQNFDMLEQEGLVVMRMPQKSAAPALRGPSCAHKGGIFAASEEAALDAELCELRKRLAERGAERRRLEQECRTSEKVGAKYAKALPAVQRAAGCSASRGENTRRLVCDVSALSDRVQSLTRSVGNGLSQM